MSLLDKFSELLQDPPPAHLFEISEAGIAFARLQSDAPQIGFQPFEPDVIAVSPVHDNVLRPEVFSAHVQALNPANGSKRRRAAALILPDYAARVAVIDFDSLPSAPEEQLSLVRFRMKKSVPFDVDSGVVAYHVQPKHEGGKHQKIEVVVAVMALEIVARYEAPFRAAGYQPGQITTSALAALNMLSVPARQPDSGAHSLVVLAKLSGRILTVMVMAGSTLKLLRCIELEQVTANQIMAVLYPTFAYIEDELETRPQLLFLCGLGPIAEELAQQCHAELALPVEPLRSRFGAPGPYNAGLFGTLERQ